MSMVLVWALVIVSVYLLATLGSWVAARLTDGLARRRVAHAADPAALRALQDRLAAARAVWPQRPRPDSYAPLDLQARGLLQKVELLLRQAEALGLEPLFFAPIPVSPAGVLAGRAWCALQENLRTIGSIARQRKLLARVQALFQELNRLQHEVAALARRARESLWQGLDEADALIAELEHGVQLGIEGEAARLASARELRNELDAALERVEHGLAEGAPLAKIETQASTTLSHVRTQLEALRKQHEQTQPAVAPVVEAPAALLEPTYATGSGQMQSAGQHEESTAMAPAASHVVGEPDRREGQGGLRARLSRLVGRSRSRTSAEEDGGNLERNADEDARATAGQPAGPERADQSGRGQPGPAHAAPGVSFYAHSGNPHGGGTGAAASQEVPPEQPEDHPLYDEAMQAMQAGRWSEALAAIEQLEALYPGHARIQQAAQWAQLRAEIDSRNRRIRPRRTTFRWYRPVLGILALLLLLAAGVYAVQAAGEYVLPILEERNQARAYANLVRRCDSLHSAGTLDEAVACYNEALQLRPEDENVQAALTQIARRQEIEAAYKACVEAQEQGDRTLALQRCMEVQRLSPGYADVQQRILALNRMQQLDALYADAEALREAGELEQALVIYEQIATLDNTYRAQEITATRFQLYMALGRAITEGGQAEIDLLLKASDYFGQALRLRPTSTEAQLERRLATLFSEGMTRYQEGLWEQALTRLRTVYEQRPTYFRETLLPMLYDTYMRSGDEFRDRGDVANAYERYLQASRLPVSDKALAIARLFEITPFLTPTPTPTATPTATPTPLPTNTPRPTVVPTPRPLASYTNQIIYRSSNPANPGFWVRDAQGGNPRYLGSGASLEQQYNALLEKYTYSPDGRYRLFVRTIDRDKTAIFVELPPAERVGDVYFVQLTNLNRLSYDPAWSPDGSRIVFVSQDRGSDDIWVVNADGSNPRNLTPNDWEWDKRPSWSPDGTKIVFWSNREGRKQLYIMDADGRNIRNISQTEWEEFDPLWVR